MSDDFYLIAHKVRGKLAFDVAVQQDSGTPSDPGPWWIIPTSGHRAYPWWSKPLAEFALAIPPMPEGTPDHYSVNDRRPAPRGRINLEDLGL